ncbi:MAG: APC family permease [Candidatus Omnitrophica bacterium]|nr:APC family permease [Candidatus Omnitrophota bacterium]
MAEAMGPLSAKSPCVPKRGPIGLFAAMSIGIGGMVGAGIFSILGVVAQTSGTALWFSFIIGGGVALLSTYSYAKLGARYPSAGGPVEFLVQGFGDGVLSGGINIYMWVGYIIALALYAHGFAGYFQTFFHQCASPFFGKIVAAGIVILFTAVNFIGAGMVGRSETVIVAIKVAILLVFSVAGAFFIHPAYLSVSSWPQFPGILFGAGVLFIGYEGFGLITNAAEDMDDPKKLLPQALYLSVASVIFIYILVSVAVIGNLHVSAIVAAKDYALAEAAKPFLGTLGFRLIAFGALFSTASAINATLFGSANVSYMLAKDGELPPIFSRHIWQGGSGGLVITSIMVLFFILFFDLSGVAMMGSGAFLLIYGVVGIAHLRVIRETGANKRLVFLSIMACLGMAAILSYYIYQNSRPAFVTMFALIPICFSLEWVYRLMNGRRIKTRSR